MILITHTNMIDYMILIFIQIRVLKQHHNNSFFQLNRKNISNNYHIKKNLYLGFYNYDILLV